MSIAMALGASLSLVFLFFPFSAFDKIADFSGAVEQTDRAINQPRFVRKKRPDDPSRIVENASEV